MLIDPPALVLTLLLKNTENVVVVTPMILATGIPADADVFVVGVTTTIGGTENALSKETVTDEELPPLAGDDPVPVSIFRTCAPVAPLLAVAEMPVAVVLTVIAGSAATGIAPQ